MKEMKRGAEFAGIRAPVCAEREVKRGGFQQIGRLSNGVVRRLRYLKARH